MIQVLHLDDDALFLHRCALSFRNSPLVAHINYHHASSSDEFKNKFDVLHPDAVMLDLSFGGATHRGLEVLRALRDGGYRGPVMMMSALSNSETILDCMRAGANDFLSKNTDEGELSFRLARLIQGKGLQTQQTNAPRHLPGHITGKSMREVQQRLSRVLNSSLRSVLVSGESGTGKEMVADMLHAQLSVGTAFIAVNCASLASNLIESEIFGHEKGAFTGANHSKIGLYEAADGGWIFLDEVARLSLAAQAALLRALENGEVRPVGGSRLRHVNVKVIAATNEPLEQMVERGEFRADLLSRLRGYEITLPPLRIRSKIERQEIIEALLGRLNSTVPVDGQEYRLTSSCLSVLTDLSWEQGNVRELWQTLQAMSVDATDGVISLEFLPQRLLRSAESTTAKASVPTPENAHSTPQSALLPPTLQQLCTPSFPLNFENIIDSVFEHLLQVLRIQSGDQNPSQRTVAQMFNITRHEASQRLSRSEQRC
ncbi:MAG: sigma-54-dependent Fis family transcriptional regulator [Betaproteobacteria bacterium]|nr:sigma-54-dependent Fis family transcriptional regulator [Betaproteobacteria bacterium]